MHAGIEFTQQYITGRLRCKTASACRGEETDTGETRLGKLRRRAKKTRYEDEAADKDIDQKQHSDHC